ncbi:MAG: LysR family transcriptional regulator [Mogibacterium sp.]|nr:LysR family transcriptional regulator [Mogibacterium sp.]MBQ3370507.1 LysR family transcriptional regulator [Mogibacterium sp.]
MDLNKLDLFFAAANSRSFTQAAEKCNVAQTTVSKYIAQLEDELGMKLFYRTTRECFLTEAGHTFYDGAKELVRDYDGLRKQLQQVNENELRIGIYGEFFDLSILSRFRDTHPDIELKVSFDSRTNLYDQLKRRKIHAVLIPNILVWEALKDHSMRTVNVLSGDAYIYCSGEAVKKYGSIQGVIRNLPFITKSQELPYHEYCRRILQRTFDASFENVTVVESQAKQTLLTKLTQGFSIMLEKEATDTKGLYAYSLEGVFNETLQLYYSIKHVPASLWAFIKYINSSESNK